ncbi:putative transcriptional regulatory protein R02753 [Alphaproteobacteria bacterium]|nr:putative transcriptional regulatory protein R02753 [Alphaproteobacteria bacterium]
MSGHSHAANIMMRKGAQDRLKAKIFSKLAKEITVAVKVGNSADPAGNSRLKQAILAARKESMPRENIDRAVAKGLPGGDDANYEDVRYEGRGPLGVAFIVEALTDNRNRTGSAVKSAFSKAGGELGGAGSATYNFSRVGVVFYPAGAGAPDALFEVAAEAGADDVVSDEEGHEIICAFENLGRVRDAMEAKFGQAESSGAEWRAAQKLEISDPDAARKLMNFIEALQDNDDVQKIWTNHDIPDAVLAALE